jgi:hypothetical protein
MLRAFVNGRKWNFRLGQVGGEAGWLFAENGTLTFAPGAVFGCGAAQTRYSARFGWHGQLASILLLTSRQRIQRTAMRSSSPEKKEDLSTLQDAELMAVVLEGRHGSFAADVAEFFALLHRQLGDLTRSKAWGGVARMVRRREHDRMLAA